MSLTGGLEALDGSDADIRTRIRHAATILGIDLAKSKLPSTDEKNHVRRGGTNSFKEQWVLRWLLKTLHAAISEASRQPNEDLHT